MKIVVLEPLEITDAKLSALLQPFLEEGHTVASLPEGCGFDSLIGEAEDADVLVLGNMPLPGETIAKCGKLKFIIYSFYRI